MSWLSGNPDFGNYFTRIFTATSTSGETKILSSGPEVTIPVAGSRNNASAD